MKYRNSIPRISAGSGAALAFALAVSTLITGSQAATRIKQDKAFNLNLGSSWDSSPGATDIAQWDVTVTGANSTVLGADLSRAGKLFGRLDAVNP